MNPTVSVVIPTREGGTSLLRCVESVAASSYSAELVEILVVDDGSQNPDAGWVSGVRNAHPGARVIHKAWGGPASARNCGINAAAGELVAFTDDDCLVARDWVAEVVRALEDDSAAGVGGRVRAADNSVISKYMDHVCALDPFLLPSGEPWYLVTANCCFRRGDLLEAGGFDTTFKLGAAEDTDLSLRLSRSGKRLKFQPSCRVSHSYANTLESFVSRFHRYGLGNRVLFEKHRIWREWPPSPAEWLWKLLNGYDEDIREFIEIQDLMDRFWFSFLGRLELIMFLTGYCCLGKGSDLDFIRGRGMEVADTAQRPEAWGDGKLDALRVLASLISGEERPRTPSKQPDAVNCDWVYQFYEYARRMVDQKLWLATTTGLLDLDDLLALTGLRADAEPSVPDDRMDDETHNRWLTLHEEQETAYGNLCVRALGFVEGGLRCVEVSRVQAACDRAGLDVRKYFAWREQIVRNNPEALDRLAPEERRIVAEVMREARQAGNLGGQRGISGS